MSVRTGAADPPVVGALAEGSARGKSLRERVRRGSIIEVVGYGANQGLRLASNLVMSRLLFPEAYGLVSIASVFMFALNMLTDVGLRDSILNHARGEERRFVNTAWTLQVIRGFVLWGIASALAWPVSWFYGDPQVAPLVIVVSFGAVISGFGSTAKHTLARRIELGPLLVIEVASKVLSMLVMFVWGYLHPTVWALIAGAGTFALFETILSHLYLPVGYRNRFEWDKDAARDIARHGRWIVGSSAFTFLAGEGDRLLLGKLLSMTMLGIYSVAGLLSSALGAVVSRLSASVVYGMLSTVAREKPEELAQHYYAARLRLDLFAMPMLGAIAVLGPVAVGILYDERYADAGWMLQILAVRVAIQNVTGLSGYCLLTLHRAMYHVPANAGRFVGVWAGVPLGYWLFGVRGVVWAAMLSEIAGFAVFAFGLRRARVLNIKRELIAPLAMLGGALLGLLIKWGLGLAFPGLAGV